MSYQLGFIGAGNMAEAIAKAAIEQAVLAPGQMTTADPLEARRAVFASMGVVVAPTNAELITHSKQVLLAVKPQAMAQVAADLAAHGREDQVVISIMAGIPSGKLAEAIGRPARIVRVMPNTPLVVGCGMAGIARGGHAPAGDEDLAIRLFSAGQSQAIRVDESVLDAITALSGSGPAYLFYLAEAMQRAASDLGLAEHASLLVGQTLLGAAQLLSTSAQTPAELRRKVTSPGGTTEAAIRHMDGNRAMDVIVNAIKAAHERSTQLGS